MTKTLKIDFGTQRLCGIVEDAIDDHNYIYALKMLNKNVEINGSSAYTNMLYAEIFDDIGLFEKCINGWFKFLDTAGPDDDFTDAYEGLAVAYLNLGNEQFSAFYYNKLLEDTPEVDADMRTSIMDSFLSSSENPLKFVYPPEIADCSDIIADGIELMKRGEYGKAVAKFETVAERNKDYIPARNYIAMCHIICDNGEEAEKECLKILETNPDDVQAITTLAAVKSDAGDKEASKQLAYKLIDLNVDNAEELYKIATVCCENGMHGEAYKLFCKLEEGLPYDSSVLYFKAISAFNCGEYSSSFAAFDRLLTLYPFAVTAKYYYDKARTAQEGGSSEPMSYFYRLPKEERESSVKVLAAFAQLKNGEAQKLFNLVDISDCVRWCFDENEGGNEELKTLAVMCAVKARLEDIISDVLLDAFCSDELKIKTLGLLCERNEPAEYGVVVCNVYKRIAFRQLNIGRAKRKQFVSAYAGLTSHFALIDSSYAERFARAAEQVYAKLYEEDNLALAADLNTLTCAIFMQSGVKIAELKIKKIYEYFGTDEQKVVQILG